MDLWHLLVRQAAEAATDSCIVAVLSLHVGELDMHLHIPINPPFDGLECWLALLYAYRTQQVRKQAEDAVKQLSNRPEVLPQLVQQLQTAADPQVRQLAAVLLRKWTPRHWDKLPLEVRK